MKILAIERDSGGSGNTELSSLLKAEARRVWELQQSGVVREVYFRVDRHDAVLVLECSDVDEAAAVLSTFPLAEAGLIRFEVIPLAAYTGFSRLFEAEGSPEESAGS